MVRKAAAQVVESEPEAEQPEREMQVIQGGIADTPTDTAGDEAGHVEAEQPPATPTSGVQGLLAGIFDQLEAAQAEASARVAKAKEELAIAERDEQAISVLLQIRKGNMPTSFAPSDHQPTRTPRARLTPAGAANLERGPKAPRGSIQAKILDSMGNDPMSAGDILTATMAKWTPDEARYRQALFNMKKKGEIGYNEAAKTYTKP